MGIRANRSGGLIPNIRESEGIQRSDGGSFLGKAILSRLLEALSDGIWIAVDDYARLWEFRE